MSLPSVTVRPLRSIAIVVVLFTLALANTAMAQELSAIIGQVRDESGAILPGVAVSVTSPVLQVCNAAWPCPFLGSRHDQRDNQTWSPRLRP